MKNVSGRNVRGIYIWLGWSGEVAELCHFPAPTQPGINNNNNNNIYLLQLGFYPVAVVILHVNKHEIGYY